MLSKAMNQRLTQVSPGTPGGELLRRYWHPIAGVAELEAEPVKPVRLLGEDLVLYKDRSGNLGLIDQACPHRRVSMEYGIPEHEGLRCPYHGWLFDHTGSCTETPAEPWNSTFKDKITIKSYPVQTLGGLVFAYLGPLPAPALPRYDLLVWDNCIRHIGFTMLPCNYVQAMENSLDPVHVEWLHGYYMDYVWSRKGVVNSERFSGRHKKIGFTRFEHGIIKRRVVEGNSEDDDPWKVGHPIVFPNILRVGGRGNYCFQYRVPVDDHQTLHVIYNAYRPGIPLPPQESVPVYELPLYDENGKFFTEVVLVQDYFAWASQGAIAERDKEHLGVSDVGLLLYRELLMEQIDRVERGEDPMEVYRKPHDVVNLPQEDRAYDSNRQLRGSVQFSGVLLQQSWDRFSGLAGDLERVFSQAEDRAERGEPLLAPPDHIEVPVGAGMHREARLLP